ncbi:MAG TPA: hypothetical protein VMT68_19375 [Caulobacteraceae bacterium]|nr:hypothetical protein [Caulobacteraceae bacterium]
MRRRAARGYILAETMVSAALAGLCGAMAVTLLVWASAAIDRAQSSVGAMRALERLYEEARLLPANELGRPANGVMGRYAWIRAPGPALDATAPDAPIPVRFLVQWTAAGRLERRGLQAVVRPVAEASRP